VVLNYKSWATFKPGCAVRDFERGGMDDIAEMVWQTDDCVCDDHNWGYMPGVAIKPTNTIVDELVDIISKRGVLMLSFAPKADGTFPEDQRVMMRELGAWLRLCGEAIYATRPYVVFGEVSEKWNEKDEHGRKTYQGTSEDIRFTRSKDNTTLYATILDWPGEKVVIKTLANADLNGVKSVKLLGVDGELKWKQTQDGMEITMPEDPGYEFAYPIRIEYANTLLEPIAPGTRNYLVRAPESVKEVNLTDGMWSKAKTGWSKPGIRSLASGRREYNKAIWAHAPSSYVYAVNKKWKTLEATAGLIKPTNGSVVFVVRGDGQELYRSDRVTDLQELTIQVDISQVNDLELTVEDGGNGNSSDNASWFATRLKR